MLTTFFIIKLTIMKKCTIAILSIYLAAALLPATRVHAQSDKNITIADSKTARSAFIETDKSMRHLFDDA